MGANGLGIGDWAQSPLHPIFFQVLNTKIFYKINILNINSI